VHSKPQLNINPASHRLLIFIFTEQMLGFIIVTSIFIFILFGSSKFIDVAAVNKDWPKYRCRPDVIFMATLYGHDALENFNFCIANAFEQRAASVVTPFFTYLKGFVDVLMTMLQSINSIRMIFATIVGSVTQVFKEFSGRIQALFYRFQMSAIRMKFLMGRVFASMYAIMFMGLAGIKATQNFGNTFLFKFLDTFCFDPNTPVYIQKRGLIKIKDVKIGDTFATGDRVTATFQFNADGQEMVNINNIIVSTNHYLLHKNKWIKAVDHPDAWPIKPWSGGDEKPLICLNTDTHSFPIGQHRFRDYDETEEGDKEAMDMALRMLNNKEPEASASPASAASAASSSEGTMACSPDTMIKVKSATPVCASSLTLGTELTMGKIAGLVKKECAHFCEYKGERFAPGTAVWSEEFKAWKRVSSLVPTTALDKPIAFHSFIVTPSACIVTSSGTVMRDYMEVHTPDLEKPYSQILSVT
jgi:hypothetical protein